MNDYLTVFAGVVRSRNTWGLLYVMHTHIWPSVRFAHTDLGVLDLTYAYLYTHIHVHERASISYTHHTKKKQNGEFTQAQPLYTELIAFRRAEQPVNPIKLSRGTICLCLITYIHLLICT